MAKKVDFYAEYDRLQSKVEGYSRQVERILDTFANESTALAVESGYEGKKYFRIDDYPDTKKLFEQLQRQSANDIRHVIINGATALWADSNFLNDKFAQSILGDKAALDEYKRYFNNNSGARDAFLRRQRNGLNLSQRIWRIQDEFKEGFEGAITVAIQEGTSAAQLSRSIRQYLREPDKLFRRIGMYNDKGELERFRLSKPALSYNPGAGMYRSSYRNAMRVAATEINMAYRQSDQLRWQQMDFIVGYEIKRSGHPYPCPVCEALKGRYPKDFVWTGWHPWCRCRSIPILKTEEEMDRDDALIMSGKEPLADSVNSIGVVPNNYKQWIVDNQDRIVRAKEHGTLPYFLKDNPYSQYFNSHFFAVSAKYSSPEDIVSHLNTDRVYDATRVSGNFTMQGYIGEIQGFNGLPEIVDQRKFDSFGKSDDYIAIFRGIYHDDVNMAMNMVNSFKQGELFHGRGIYGNGSYFASNETIAKYYGIKGGAIIRAYIDGSMANIVDYDSLKKEFNSEKRKFQNTIGDMFDSAKKSMGELNAVQYITKYQSIFDDIGSYATAKGYDAISVPDENYYVILNRTMLKILK